MYRTRKRGEGDTSAGGNWKEIDLMTFNASRFSARTPSRIRRRIENAGIRRMIEKSDKYIGWRANMRKML